MPDGSWKCEKCSNINYPFRVKCNRQNCGADKPSESTKSPSPSPDENDQVCHLMHFLCMCICCLNQLLCRSFVCVRITNLIDIEIYNLLESPFQWQLSFPIVCLHGYVFPVYVSNFCIASTSASVNLSLSTVPVSTRTCLRVEKVQGCHPALLNMGVWKSVMSSSPCCSGCCYSAFSWSVSSCTNFNGTCGLYGSFFYRRIMCQPALSGKILQVGSGFY